MIVFHMGEFDGKFPRWRLTFQRWIFLLFESPIHSNDFIKYDVLFNMSSTYKLESNTTSYYFQQNPFYWNYNVKFDENYNFLADKKEFSAIIISNCNDKSGRIKLLNKIKHYIPVQVYGKCGTLCTNSLNHVSKDDCRLNIFKNYMFYFAFENSICEEYITEKFFDLLKYNIIPIVLGGGDYSKHIPKSGYINVQDYSNPKDLADYMLYLSKNKAAYNSYFRWKKHVIFDENIIAGHICELCIILNLDAYKKIETRSIGKLSEFWNAKKECKI
jgi:alpha-1,3-fucosyltransferase